MSEIMRRFRRWESAVKQIEEGGPIENDEYLDLVDRRELLYEAISHHPHPEALADVDARFKASTQEVEECVWGTQNAVENGWTAHKHWWYFRDLRSK